MTTNIGMSGGTGPENKKHSPKRKDNLPPPAPPPPEPRAVGCYPGIFSDGQPFVLLMVGNTQENITIEDAQSLAISLVAASTSAFADSAMIAWLQAGFLHDKPEMIPDVIKGWREYRAHAGMRHEEIKQAAMNAQMQNTIRKAVEEAQAQGQGLVDKTEPEETGE